MATTSESTVRIVTVLRPLFSTQQVHDMTYNSVTGFLEHTHFLIEVELMINDEAYPNTSAIFDTKLSIPDPVIFSRNFTKP